MRVEQSRALLLVIKKAERTHFQFFATGDESWFFYRSPTRGLWVPPDEPAPTAPKPSHYAPKTMVTIFWNPSGALHVCALPEGVTWTAQYFIEHVLIPLMNTECYKQCRKQRRKFTLHMDNARVHTAAIVQRFIEENGFVCAPHPPYSPDLAPSDFYLFGALKERIRGIEFEDSDEIVRWIIDEFEQIPTRELRAAFSEWKDRLARVKCGDGSYLR